MKKLSIFILLFLLSSPIFGQSDKLNAIFDQYQGKDGVTSIKIAKPMFKMLGNLKIDNDELGRITPLLSKVNGLKMLIVEKPESGAAVQKTIENDVISAITNLNYQEFMTVNNTEAKIKFMAQDITSNVVENLILNLTSEDSTILMMLDGKISMDDINSMMQETKSVTSISPTKTIQSKDNTGSVRNVEVFTGVEVSSGIELEFTQQPETSVVVKTEPDKQQYVITEVENGILKVFIRNKGVRNLNFNNLKVLVSAPIISQINTKSGASFKAKIPLVGENLELRSTSGSSVYGDFKLKSNVSLQAESGSNVKISLETKNVSTSVSSGSSVKISGKAESGTYSISSGSSISAADFVIKNVVAEATSGSSLKLHSTSSLTASATSGSSIDYKGNPQNVKTSVNKLTGASISPIK